jgi:hypothetical protein
VPHDIKPRKMMNFHKITQSWVGNENKNVDIEFTRSYHDSSLTPLVLNG